MSKTTLRKGMKKTALVNWLAERFDISRKQAREILDELAVLATREVSRTGEFVLPGFGKLVLSKRRAREGRNPATGEAISIPSKATLKLRLSSPMKDAILPPRIFERSDAIEATTDAVAQKRPSRAEQARYVNVCLVRSLEASSVVQMAISLSALTTYYVRVDIGDLSPESVVQNATPFPDGLLPETKTGHWLEAVAVSDDFRVEPSRHYLFLPKGGASWVCDCAPGGKHTCTKQTRRPYVLIPVKTPRESTAARLRLCIYYQNNLIQSQLLTAEIVQTERQGAGYSSYIDYTLTAKLNDISFLPARTLNIFTNENANGTHKIVINGRTGEVIDFNLTEGQMRGTIKAARDGLHAIHIKVRGQRREDLYDENNSKKKELFIADLKLLAGLGRELFTLLFGNKLELQVKLSEEMLNEPASIQVCRVSHSTFVFPWSLVYDIPLESNAAKYKNCRLLEEWERASTLIPESSPRCPYQDEHDLNVICPFGFWGFKHVIEQPPSMPAGRNLPTKINVSNRPVEMVIGFSEELDKNLTQDHLRAIRERLNEFTVSWHDSGEEIAEALADPKLEIVYFYCHGRRKPLPGSSEPIPYLELEKGGMLTPSDIVAWRRSRWRKSQHWQETSPLIFINGCHTAELTPESIVNFVDVFFGAYASGVIGTEITLSQRAASEAAIEFLSRFQSEGVGRSLQLMRRQLLLKGNLLGLAYTPYCSAALQLSS